MKVGTAYHWQAIPHEAETRFENDHIDQVYDIARVVGQEPAHHVVRSLIWERIAQRDRVCVV